MNSLEPLLICALGIWVVASVWYAFRLPGARRVLRPLNGFHVFARWTMFGAVLEGDSVPTTLEIEYRDTGAGGASTWLAAFPGYPARWRGFFWLPERRVRRRLEDLADEIKRNCEQTPAAGEAVAAKFAIIEKYLEATRPLGPDRRREIRVVERTLDRLPAASSPAETVVLIHRAAPHA